LDGYREEQSKGKKLSAEILQAVSHFDEVVASLELARSLIQEFEKIGMDSVKDEKKRKAQEHADRKQSELTRLKDVLSIQVCWFCPFFYSSVFSFLIFFALGGVQLPLL